MTDRQINHLINCSFSQSTNLSVNHYFPLATEVKSADGTWGWLQQYEGYSRPDDSPEDYKQISYEESLSKYKNYQHAGHAMYFAKTDTVLWGLYKTRACILVRDTLFFFNRPEYEALQHTLYNITHDTEYSIP